MNDQVAALNSVNRALLPILRNFLNAFTAPETLGWRNAFAAATGTWGEARGLAIANHFHAFIGAVLSSRPVPLHYADPMDLDARGQLTLDERAVLALLTAMRQDDPNRARDLISQLTGGRVDAAIVRTGLVLAKTLDPMGDPKGPKRPALQLVS